MKSLLNKILPLEVGDILTRNKVKNFAGMKYKIKIISIGYSDVLFERLDHPGSFLIEKQTFLEQYER